MNKPWLVALAMLLCPLPCHPGEIIGNTYIGEKHGYIEIQSPDGKWQIQDREGQSNQIAILTLKDAINGTRPTMLFFGIPNPGGVTLPEVAQWGRDAIEKNGFELGTIETRRYGGKPAIIFTATITKGGGRATMLSITLEGPKSFFQVYASANAVAYDAAKPLFEEVVEKLKF